MYGRQNTGTEWIEGLFLLAGALWLMGALLVSTMVALGVVRLNDASVSPASNQTPVAESPQTE